MSINMYLEETDAQTSSMNCIFTRIIQAMEDTKSSIASFIYTSSLQGETYRSAKTFMTQTYFPLAQGIIYLCEELLRQNAKYPSDFRAQVSTTDVVEQEIMEQIYEIDRMIARLEGLNDKVPLFSMSIYVYQTMKRMLEEKLTSLHQFNASTANNYQTALQLAKSVTFGLSQIQGGRGFNRSTGTFSTQGMDLSWVSTIDQIHYTRLAKEKYGHYLKENPDDLHKIIAIIKYEETNEDYVNAVNDFLLPLEQRDIIGIKFLMYTAEEPYRTLTMQYLHRLELILVELPEDENESPGPSFFTPSKNSITYVYERDRTNRRGAYFTIFHEIAHAIDYNYGKDVDGSFIRDIKEFFGTYEYFTDSHEVDGKTLNDHLYNDFELTVRKTLENELIASTYKDLSRDEKNLIVDIIAENLLNQDRNFDSLSTEEVKLQMLIEDQFAAELRGSDHSMVSDVYGGITNFTIQGSYGHTDDYWFKNGKRIREPNREGFAEYFARLVTDDGKDTNPGIESVERYLPGAKDYMDKMVESMDRK